MKSNAVKSSHPQTRQSEAGSAIFYVLIAVTLLVALSFAVSQSMQGGADGLTKERSRLFATDILEYMNVVNNAVTQLRLRGCLETQLSFENPVVGVYTNGGAPTNNTCHVFVPAGGGISWTNPPEGATGAAGAWKFSGVHHIDEVGTCSGGSANCSELLLILEDVDTTVCAQINALSNVENVSSAPPAMATAYTGTAFTGSFGNNETYDAAQIQGKKVGCFTLTGVGNYAYRVLLAR